MNHFLWGRLARWTWFSLVVCCSLAAMGRSEAQEISEVWDKPVQVGSVSVTLPAPSFEDAMDASQQETVLKEVAGKYPLDRFLKDSIVAPFSLRRENIKDESGKRLGHRIDVWFVAYGSLEEIQDKDLFASLVKAQGGGERNLGEVLPEDALKARGLSATQADGCDRNWYRFSIELLDRVLLQGVVAAITNSTDTSHFAGVRLDDHFRDDEAFSNRWRHLDTEPTASAAYSGLAGYAKATQLAEYPGAILVECHAVLHEPVDWFQGANLLSSKLPLAIQDAIRSFRRKLSN